MVDYTWRDTLQKFPQGSGRDRDSSILCDTFSSEIQE